MLLSQLSQIIPGVTEALTPSEEWFRTIVRLGKKVHVLLTSEVNFFNLLHSPSSNMSVLSDGCQNMSHDAMYITCHECIHIRVVQ